MARDSSALRKFRGKTFHDYTSFAKKQDAVKLAEKYRRNGYNCRIVKVSGNKPYVLYINYTKRGK